MARHRVAVAATKTGFLSLFPGGGVSAAAPPPEVRARFIAERLAATIACDPRRCEKRSMSASVTVRPANADDESAMGRLGAMLVEEHYEFDPKRFIAPIAMLPERYGRFLVSQTTRPEMVVLVAERNGEVVGYAFGGMEGNDYMALRGPAGALHDLVIDPAHRRQGIGSALLQAALRALSKLGAPRVVLFTAEKNHGARAMFEDASFRRTMIEMTREL